MEREIADWLAALRKKERELLGDPKEGPEDD
jgi:hypothetical protein